MGCCIQKLKIPNKVRKKADEAFQKQPVLFKNNNPDDFSVVIGFYIHKGKALIDTGCYGMLVHGADYNCMLLCTMLGLM